MAIIIAVILLFLGIGMLVLVHVCIVGRSFILRGFQSSPRFEFDVNNNNDNTNRTMSDHDVQKLPCYDYKAKDRENSSWFQVLDCAVCLEEFKTGEKCRLLPLCMHSFHAECVDSWLLRNPICPVCRTSAGSGEPGSGLGEQSRRHGDGFVDLREHHSRESSNLDDVRIEVRNST